MPAPTPSRRNLLLGLAGGAVVVVGGGTAVAIGLGGSSGTTSEAATQPAVGGAAPSTAVAASSSPGVAARSSAAAAPSPEQRPLPPTGPLPPATGALGTLQGPNAVPFWDLPKAGAITSMAVGEGVLVLGSPTGVSGFDLGGNQKWGPVLAAGVAGAGNGVVSGGLVYLTVASGAGADLLALDVKTGAQKWRTPIPQRSLLDMRVAGALGGMVFVLGTSGSAPFLWAVDAVSGAVRWQKSGGQFATLTVPSKGTQVLAVGLPNPTTPVTAVALDVHTGGQAWAHQLGTSVDYTHMSLSKAALAGDVYVLLDGAPDADSLVAGSTANGQPAWTAKMPEPAGDAGTLSLVTYSADSGVMVALSRRGLYAAEANSGKVRWFSQSTEFLDTASDRGAPQIADGNVYVYDQKGTWWAVSLETGRVRWKYSAAGFAGGADPVWAAVPGGVVLYAGGKLVMIAAKG